MKVSKLHIILLILASLSLQANDIPVPQFKDYPIRVSTGSFTSVLKLTSEQKKFSAIWGKKLSSELNKSVNFAGHYRLYLSQDGEFQNECGKAGWVCGWIIDKVTGVIVSELPEFNGNTAYFSIIDNGTPSPDLFYIEFYPNKTIIRIGGKNTPKSKQNNLSYEDVKCAYSTYNFVERKFVNMSSVGCEDDQN